VWREGEGSKGGREEGRIELSGAIDVCKSMEGTYSQWINVLLWSRRLGLSFFFL
jgi:hypothetical protein